MDTNLQAALCEAMAQWPDTRTDEQRRVDGACARVRIARGLNRSVDSADLADYEAEQRRLVLADDDWRAANPWHGEAVAAAVERRARHLWRAAVPPGIGALTLDAVNGAASAAVAWYASGGRGLVIRGSVGTGKSCAAATVALEHYRSDGWSPQAHLRVERAEFERGLARLAHELEARPGVSWHRPDGLVSAVLHSYDERAPKLGRALVVVDDVGRETKGSFDEALCAFLDDASTRFVLTTNLDRAAFRARYEDRLIDRLNDCARAITAVGESRRKRGDF